MIEQTSDTEQTGDVRARIMRAAAELLAQGGRQAVSSRAVSATAGVQAPTIYRQFGDMRGLLNAVVRETFSEYVRKKAIHASSDAPSSDDPIEDLRRGWDMHVAFGLDNPAVYALIYGDPTLVADTPASQDGYTILHELVSRVGQMGRLRVSVPHATRLIATAGEGVTLSLISTPPEARDEKLSVAMREAVISAITIAPASDHAPESALKAGRVAARAVALRAVLDEAPGVLSTAEQHLLGEWLDRLADADSGRLRDGQAGILTNEGSI